VVSPPSQVYFPVNVGLNETVTGYDFVIAPSGGGPAGISGTVTYQATGEPAPDVYVVIFNEEENSSLGWNFAETDSSGFYQFGDIVDGTWLIGVYQPGYASDPSLREASVWFGGPPATDQDFQLVEGTGVLDGFPAGVPGEFHLYQNRPNPFNDGTLIAYTLSNVEPQRVTLRVFNVLGQEVRTLVDGHQRAGLHLVRWDGRDHQGLPVASGIYFCELRAGGERQSGKLVLLR